MTADEMGTPSLLDQLEAPDVHSMLPSMALACGQPWVHATPTVRYVLGTRRAGTSDTVTCRTCITRYGGLDGLRAEIRRAQQRQASA